MVTPSASALRDKDIRRLPQVVRLVHVAVEPRPVQAAVHEVRVQVDQHVRQHEPAGGAMRRRGDALTGGRSSWRRTAFRAYGVLAFWGVLEGAEGVCNPMSLRQ